MFVDQQASDRGYMRPEDCLIRMAQCIVRRFATHLNGLTSTCTKVCSHGIDLRHPKLKLLFTVEAIMLNTPRPL